MGWVWDFFRNDGTLGSRATKLKHWNIREILKYQPGTRKKNQLKMDGNGDFQPTISYVKVWLNRPIDSQPFIKMVVGLGVPGWNIKKSLSTRWFNPNWRSPFQPFESKGRVFAQFFDRAPLKGHELNHYEGRVFFFQLCWSSKTAGKCVGTPKNPCLDPASRRGGEWSHL